MTSKIVVNNIGSDTGINTVTFDSNVERGTSNLHSVGVEVAGINVLGADTPIGTGSTIYDDGGARFSGIVTATAFHGSGANLTSIPAGQLTGTLPAISGANLTGIGATGTIIQTIKKSLASDFATTSTSFQDVTGLTQSITLSNANNKVIVIAVLSFVAYADRDRRATTAVFHTNLNASNKLTEQYGGEYRTGDSNSYSYGGHTHYILDTPGTTSRTYKVGFNNQDGSSAQMHGIGGGVYDRSYIILQEISQ